MMTYDEWLKALVEAAQHIANREYQEKHWFREKKGVEWADEVFLRLEDLAFDLFFQMYSHTFTTEQQSAWKEFKTTVDHYETKLPRYPDSQRIINDPEWQMVREAAARFVTAFQKPGDRKL